MRRIAAGCGLALIIWLAIRLAVPAPAPSWTIQPPDPTDWAPDRPADTTYRSTPLPSMFEQRKQALFEQHGSRPGGGIYAQLVRLHLGHTPQSVAIEEAVNRLDRRLDTADFQLAGLIRLLYQFSDSPQLDDETVVRIRRSILAFKYWPDEPGTDNMCTWSENHFILFASGAYLAGQFFPDSLFSNSGVTGRDLAARAKPRILRWLELRFRSGYSEWLSNVYYTEDIAALLNLIDFSADEQVASKATMVLDLTLLDLALNHFNGTFGSTHGRSYFGHKVDGSRESTTSMYRLLFGLNAERTGNMGSIALALSTRYRLPEVIYDVATDSSIHIMTNCQRMGIQLEQAERWNLDTERLEDGMTFLTLEAYNHPITIDLTVEMFERYGWWENAFFKPYAPFRRVLSFARKLGLMPILARIFYSDLSRNYRPEVNIYTYRTRDYMLSSAQDWEKGRGGDQQHIWSATLGPQTNVFTTHPARFEGDSPNFWTGSGNLPRVAQHENVVIALYDISMKPGLYVTHNLDFTHAWFPKSAFDETKQHEHWTFGRKDSGYVALWSQQPVQWRSEGAYRERELIAPGKRNIWLCEMGSSVEDGSFDAFVDRIQSAKVETNGLSIVYHSPSVGRMLFSWDGPLQVDGATLSLDNYPRYSNPYVEAGFPSDRIEVRHNEKWLVLDYNTGERSFSGLLGRSRG